MRILAINYEYPPLGGGGGVVFQQIAEELARDHEVVVLTSHFDGLDECETHGNLRVHRLPVLGRTGKNTATMRSMVSFVPACVRFGKSLMKRQRFDVINTHFAVPSGPGGHRLSRRFGVPNVLSIHGGDLYDPSKRLSPHRLPLVRSVVRRVLRGADRVVAQSRNTADNAKTYYGVTRHVDIIPLGIRPPTVLPASRDGLRIGADRFVVVTIGRLVARKAIDDLIRAISELRDPRYLLIVIGSGPKQAEWQSLAQSLDVAGQVRFTGQVDEDYKWQVLSVSDIYASSSLHEGFGLVFLEAMHCGLPVVCYDHGGQTDFLDDGTTGGLIPAGDRAAFRDALRRLMASAATRMRIGAFNRARVRAYYIDACARRYETLFRELVAGSAL